MEWTEFCWIMALVLFTCQNGSPIVVAQNQSDAPGKDKIVITYCKLDFKCPYYDNANYAASSVCSCHPACQFFGDCCYNTLETYINNSAIDRFVSQMVHFTTYYQCVHDVISHKRYWMISKCPDTWTVPNDCDRNREHVDATIGNLEDNLASIPVVTADGRTYRNIFCAQCHGENLSNLSAWSFHAYRCMNYETDSVSNFTQTFVHLTDNCGLVTFGPPEDHPYSSLSMIPCHTSAVSVIDTCAGLGDETNAAIQDQCSFITAPIEVDGKLFKNTFCAKCYFSTNYIERESCRQSGSSRLPTAGIMPVPITVTFHFKSESAGVSISRANHELHRTTVTCNDSQVFDPIINTCIYLTCPSGYSLDEKGLCLRSSDVTTNSSTCDKFTVEIVTDELTWQENISCARKFETLLNCLPVDFSKLLRSDIAIFNISCRWNDNKLQVLTAYTMLSLVVERLLEKKENRLVLTSDECAKSLNFIEIRAHCSIFQTDAQCDTLWLNETQWSQVENAANGIFVNNSSEFVNSAQIIVRHSFGFSSLPTALTREEVQIKRCHIVPRAICPYVTLNASLFTPLENDTSTLVYVKNNSHQFTKDMYENMDNGSIRVCNFFKQSGIISYNSFLPEYSLLQTILSTIGMIISLFCLTVTLVTYCAFRSLRTHMSSVLIMTFCACLIAAQLLLLLSGVSAPRPLICSLVSGLGHYCWLTVFSTSNVLGFLMYQTFNPRNQLTRRGTPSKRSICLFLLPCFGIPAIISGSLLSLRLFGDETYPISYGSSSVCWIEDHTVNLYAFGIPVAVSSVLNNLFFIGITLSICLQKRGQVVIRTNRQNSQFRDLLIYVKIFIILGLTWNSGFVAALVDQEWMWNLFIVFTSSQGVFICIAFTAKSQIWNMWSKRLGIKSDISVSQTKMTSYDQSKDTKREVSGNTSSVV